jgi:hypothetical protein
MKSIQSWKRCADGQHDLPAVEPHLDFCFEHAPPAYKRAWRARMDELYAKEQALIDYFGENVFNTVRGCLRLPEQK